MQRSLFSSRWLEAQLLAQTWHHIKKTLWQMMQLKTRLGCPKQINCVETIQHQNCNMTALRASVRDTQEASTVELNTKEHGLCRKGRRRCISLDKSNSMSRCIVSNAQRKFLLTFAPHQKPEILLVLQKWNLRVLELSQNEVESILLIMFLCKRFMLFCLLLHQMDPLCGTHGLNNNHRLTFRLDS